MYGTRYQSGSSSLLLWGVTLLFALTQFILVSLSSPEEISFPKGSDKTLWSPQHSTAQDCTLQPTLRTAHCILQYCTRLQHSTAQYCTRRFGHRSTVLTKENSRAHLPGNFLLSLVLKRRGAQIKAWGVELVLAELQSCISLLRESRVCVCVCVSRVCVYVCVCACVLIGFV